MIHPLIFAAPCAVFEIVTFYWWHWPYRHLLPERFRKLLLFKGFMKGITLVILTCLVALYSLPLAWLYAIAHTLFGIVFHVIWCRKRAINPITVQPRREYVLATTAWVDRLVKLEEARQNAKN